jgi:hypothetical protein
MPMPTQVKPIELKDPLRMNDQVLTQKGWIPEGLFPELDDLREEHHRLLDETYEVRDESIALHKQYEDEDEAREAALLAGDEPPPVTGSAERHDALSDVRVRLQAKWDIVTEFVKSAITTINEKYGAAPEFPDEPGLVLPEWRQMFAAQRAKANEEIEKAQEALRAAEGKEAGIKGNERWLDMTVRARGGVYMAASQSPPTMTRAEWDSDKVPPALSGMGMS